MPFGEYKKIRCDNPDCKEWFRPITPWQTHCKKKCANRTSYLGTVVLKRLEKAFKGGEIPPSTLERRLQSGFEKLRRIKEVARPAMSGRIARLEARMGLRWNKVQIVMGKKKLEG